MLSVPGIPHCVKQALKTLAKKMNKHPSHIAACAAIKNTTEEMHPNCCLRLWLASAGLLPLGGSKCLKAAPVS